MSSSKRYTITLNLLQQSQLISIIMSTEDGYRPNTTFTKRPRLPQIVSYLVFSLQTILFYVVVLNSFSSSTQKVVFGSLYSLSLVALIWSTVVSGYKDPSDSVMIFYKNSSMNEFQQFRKAYQGKLLFCDFCHSYVQLKSRHCKVCDRQFSSNCRCAQDFDHHCMWINNCVGGTNYRWFLAMILSAFSNLLIYVVSLVRLTFERNYLDFLAGFVAAWISGVINAIFVILLVNLILLHLYLIYKGISTYEFIVAQREAQKLKNKQVKSPQNEDPNNVKEVESGKQQTTNGQFNLEKNNYQMDNIVRVRSRKESQNQAVDVEAQDKNGPHQKVEFAELGDKYFTEKSEQLSHQNNKFSHKDVVGNGVSQDENIVQLSELFTRNRSLKFIIGQTEYYRPRRLTSIYGEQQVNRYAKCKSLFVGNHNLKELN